MRKLYLLFAFAFFSAAYGQEPFISTWTVYNSNVSIFLPVSGENFSVDFGDGTVLTGLSSGVSHTYETEGTYSVSVSGNYNRINFSGVPYDLLSIVSIDQWGDAQWISMEQAFKDISWLVIDAVDTPDLSQVTSMKEMFMGAGELGPSLNNWDVSHVTNMEGLFRSSRYYSSLNNWNVANVVDMSYMFYDTDNFIGSIQDWDVSNVENMAYMFYGSLNFDQPLDNWDVSSVTNMQYMFHGTIFNHPLNSWNVSSVTNMSNMFANANEFNQPLNNWNVSHVTDMSFMFNGSNFNQPLNNWDVSNVVTMENMFNWVYGFNQPLNNWDVSNVLNMTGMFYSTEYFNQDLSDWDFNSEVNLTGFLEGSGLNTDNFDSLLLRFAQLGLENKQLNSCPYYCDSGAFNYLINELGWVSFSFMAEECQGNIISGTVHFDENGNGCDTSDIPMKNILMAAQVGTGPFIYIASVNNAGEYNLKVMENTYTPTLLNIPDYFTATPQQSSVTFVDYGNEETVNFCLTANQSVQDLNITLLPIGQARPGFASQYQLIAQNIGTQTVANATVSLSYDSAIQSFTNAVPVATSATSGQLTFDLTNLQPFESRVIYITMQTLAPPTVNGGEVINFTTSVTPDSGDLTPADNTFALAQTVVNSFDPNDKQVLQGDEISLEQAEGYLDYLIRFQNTGTASAITVRIKDNLPENVDWTTLRPVSSSHPYTLKLKDDHTIEFIFDNINLPHEAADEPGSHGFIAYKIKPLETVAVGDIITGNAEIFFDYNLPIVTNFATTEVMDTAGINENIASRISIYPNPVSNVLYLNASDGIAIEQVKVYNLQGRELMSFNKANNINVENLSSGVYILMIKTDAGIEKHKLVKK